MVRWRMTLLSVGMVLACGGMVMAQGSGSSRYESRPARRRVETPRSASAQKAMPGRPVTVVGTLVDMKCYTMMPAANIGDDHRTEDGTVMEGCAAACAKMGIPVGIVPGGKAGGHALVLAVPAKQLAPHMGRTARVMGRQVGESLIVKSIQVQEDGSWKTVKVKTMM